MKQTLIFALISLLVGLSGPVQSQEGLSADELALEGEVAELDWETLIPEDFNPYLILDQFGNFDELADDDPRVEQVMAELQTALDNAPVVEELNGRRIKLPGFVVPLEGDGRKISEFLLVPYYGACIHEPPPPANQTVYVQVPKRDAQIRGAFDTVWVTGILYATAFDSDLATAGYRIEAEKIEPYDESPPYQN